MAEYDKSQWQIDVHPLDTPVNALAWFASERRKRGMPKSEDDPGLAKTALMGVEWLEWLSERIGYKTDDRVMAIALVQCASSVDARREFMAALQEIDKVTAEAVEAHRNA